MRHATGTRTRPHDWWVLDLDGDPTPGSPAAVCRMARRWSQVADDAAYAERRLRQLMADEALGRWLGEAGDAFRSKTGDLPDQLGRCADSYGQAADALDWWAGRLETHQHEADHALTRGRAAHEDLEDARRRAAAAASALGDASTVAALTDPSLVPTPDQVHDAQARLRSARAARSSADAAVADAQSRLDAARRLALDAMHLREADGRTVAERIHEAAEAGIPERSRWDKLKDWAGEAWDVVVTIAKVVVAELGVVALIIGGPLAWLVFAAALVLLADAILRHLRGECSLWEVALAALGCIPGTKGLTTLAALRAEFAAGGLVGAGVHVLASGKAALVHMTRSVRLVARNAGYAVGVRVMHGLTTWTGEGLALSGEALALTKAFAADAIRFEPGITRAMQGIVSELPGAELAGLESRLKTFDSMGRKVASSASVRHTASEVLGGVNDSVRYTVQVRADDLATATATMTDRLIANGFENLAFKNSFGGPRYQGINTSWVDPSSGHAFEIQFHTPESFEATKLTHRWYEEQRLPRTPEHLATEIQAAQNRVFATVPTPPGARDVALPASAPMARVPRAFEANTAIGHYVRKPVKFIAYQANAAFTD
jgi:hypothetical protein